MPHATRVADDVVEEVGTDGVADDVADERILESGELLVRLRLEDATQLSKLVVTKGAPKNRAHLAVGQQRLDAISVLVVPNEQVELVLQRVPKRHMGQVVEQGAETGEPVSGIVDGMGSRGLVRIASIMRSAW